MAFDEFGSISDLSGSTIPDVARGSRIDVAGTLDKVGMAQIEVPVRLRDDDGMLFLAPAKAEA